ncbi:MAG: LysM peptidoglycan-binding domain-containing protein, partial [Turicibacter sp.]
MKIHIVQRNDSFQTIANKYGVSVQDLIGMNTHINHLTGLVPGLKVKVPSQQRKEEPTVDQHIQKYYPNLEPAAVQPQVEAKPEQKPQPSVQPVVPIPVQTVTQVPVETKPQQEEVIPIPLKPFPGFEEKPTKPNDGVKVTDT